MQTKEYAGITGNYQKNTADAGGFHAGGILLIVEIHHRMIIWSEQEYYQCCKTDQNENPNYIQHRFDNHQKEQFKEKGYYEASPMRFCVITVCLRTEIEKADDVRDRCP